MKIVTTSSDTIEPALYNLLVRFVQQIILDNPKIPASKNMGLDSESGLLWNIENKKRWTSEKGEIAILLNDQEEVVGVSCVERTEQSLLSIGGIRTWVLKPYRGKNVVSNMLLGSNLEWSTQNDMAGMMLTFNDYNKWIYDGIKKKTSGKAPGLDKIWSDWWDDCIVMSRPIKVRYVNQWCVIKPTGRHSPDILKSLMEGLDAISE
jgi:hypothetical protein